MAVLIIGIIGSFFLYFGPRLCIGCPNSVGFNGAASNHTIQVETLSSQLTTITTGPNPPGTYYGGVSWPIANAASSFTVTNPQFFNQPFGTWLITLPSDQSGNCYNGGAASAACQGGSYQFTSTVSAPVLLSAANSAALWANEGSFIPTNPYTFNSTYTSTVNAPTGCSGAGVVLGTSQSCVVSWTIARYYFSVNMQTQGATLSLNCASNCQAVSCFFGTLCNTQVYTTAFQSGVTGALNSVINPAAYLSSPTQLGFQLNLPPNLAGQSNLDTAGIIAAWTLNPGGSGGGVQVGDLMETNCGGVAGGFGACSIVEGQIHTPLSLFSDSAQSTPYAVNIGAQVGVQQYTAAQLAVLKLLPTVYTAIHINQFGAQFQMNSGCFITNYQGCFQVSQPQAVLTIGMDVLTTTHTIRGYPSPAPQTGTNAGSLDGQVIDGSLFWHPGVAGASVCFIDITGCSGVSGSGNFNLTNVAAGTHTVQITAVGFNPSPSITVNVPTAGTYHAGQISLSESNPWYLAQLCFSNPLSFTPGGLTCIPYLVIGLSFAVVAIVAIAALKIYKPKGL